MKFLKTLSLDIANFLFLEIDHKLRSALDSPHDCNNLRLRETVGSSAACLIVKYLFDSFYCSSYFLLRFPIIYVTVSSARTDGKSENRTADRGESAPLVVVTSFPLFLADCTTRGFFPNSPYICAWCFKSIPFNIN